MQQASQADQMKLAFVIANLISKLAYKLGSPINDMEAATVSVAVKDLYFSSAEEESIDDLDLADRRVAIIFDDLETFFRIGSLEISKNKLATITNYINQRL